jgi:hypothetical protein
VNSKTNLLILIRQHQKQAGGYSGIVATFPHFVYLQELATTSAVSFVIIKRYKYGYAKFASASSLFNTSQWHNSRKGCSPLACCDRVDQCDHRLVGFCPFIKSH